MDDYNEIANRISYLGFCASIKQGKKVEVEIVGEGAVKDVVIQDDKLVIIGEDKRQSFETELIRQRILSTPESPKYDFKRDYHGQFKKKEG